MATAEIGTVRDFTATRTADTSGAREAVFAEHGLSLTAIGGAIAGAVAGTALGTEVGSAFTELWSTLGVMIGSGLAAGAWCLVASLRPGD
jgi:hypothetical protein